MRPKLDSLALFPVPQTDLATLDERARTYAEAARADRTQRAYASDMAHFRKWANAHGETCLPATSRHRRYELQREVIAAGLFRSRVQVAADRRDRRMPQGVPDGREIRAAAQGMGAVGVPQEVRRDGDVGDPGEESGTFDPLPCVDRAHRKKIVLAQSLGGSQGLEFFPGAAREPHDARLAALARHVRSPRASQRLCGRRTPDVGVPFTEVSSNVWRWRWMA